MSSKRHAHAIMRRCDAYDNSDEGANLAFQRTATTLSTTSLISLPLVRWSSRTFKTAEGGAPSRLRTEAPEANPKAVNTSRGPPCAAAEKPSIILRNASGPEAEQVADSDAVRIAHLVAGCDAATALATLEETTCGDARCAPEVAEMRWYLRRMLPWQGTRCATKTWANKHHNDHGFHRCLPGGVHEKYLWL